MVIFASLLAEVLDRVKGEYECDERGDPRNPHRDNPPVIDHVESVDDTKAMKHCSAEEDGRRYSKKERSAHFQHKNLINF